ncbi:hypothetical protein ASA1KI_17550 [Opitutales bacterium ASA1]|uniref:hypothetical protein n=1 Tax=Congregicoccus parvus TaxID=3081749 RepID=UPI002B2F261D|nr:hypothetical protein ASA1KI_17550 [Opitutales bacterium ASA1]
MSLINDALKKAQSMQSPGQTSGLKLASKPLQPRSAAHPGPSAPPALTPDTGTRVAPPRRKPRTGLILAIAGGVFAGVICLGIGAMFLLWPAGADGSAPAVIASAEPTADPMAEATSTTYPPEPVAVRETAPPAPAPFEPPVVATVAAAPVDTVAEPLAVADSRPIAPARPRDPRLQAFALGIRVAGIRTGENPKALMNDRVYGIGEFVSPDHDLRLSKVDTRMLELEDSHGNVYEVRF